MPVGGAGRCDKNLGDIMLYAILAAVALASGPAPFAIQVVDAETGRGVPLIELRTVHEVRYVTDSGGMIAFDDPALFQRTVFFHVSGHGYEFPKDGFGYRGKALAITPGGTARLEVRRRNVAERLYRVTGAGLYADTLRVGRTPPLAEPLLNAEVLGQDSVETVRIGDTLRWFWGDTSRPGYPLGNFHVPGATSKLPSAGGLNPDAGVDLAYFPDDRGFAKPTCAMPGPGPTWIGGLAVVPGDDGKPVIQAGYVKIRNMLEAYEHGLVRFDEAKAEFAKRAVFPEGKPLYPSGHPIEAGVTEGSHVQFATPYPWTRVRATAEAMADIAAYEGYTPLVAGTTPKDGRIDRDEAGRLRYGWKAQTAPLSFEDQQALGKSGALRPGEGLHALRDVDTGRAVRAHGGTVHWNPYRRRWAMIAVEIGGSESMLGEVWYAEAEAPEGPWVHARKVVTHDRYSFYNPRHHPYFDGEGGRFLYFEGTYTQTFSGNPGPPTPRYDYNQVMYRLDLDDPRVNLPVGVWTDGDPKAVPPRFYALERPGAGTVALAIPEARRAFPSGGDPPPVFHGYAVGAMDAPAATVGLFREAGPDGATRYRTAPDPTEPGWTRPADPIARVWPNPLRVAIPPRPGS
jgi:hypothetical protein